MDFMGCNKKKREVKKTIAITENHILESFYKLYEKLSSEKASLL